MFQSQVNSLFGGEDIFVGGWKVIS